MVASLDTVGRVVLFVDGMWVEMEMAAASILTSRLPDHVPSGVEHCVVAVMAQ
jgi:hypothetical protein